MVLVPMSIEATFSGEEGLDFTTEFLGKDVGGQFRLEDFIRRAVIQVVRLERGSRDNTNEELMGRLTGDRVN